MAALIERHARAIKPASRLGKSDQSINLSEMNEAAVRNCVGASSRLYRSPQRVSVMQKKFGKAVLDTETAEFLGWSIKDGRVVYTAYLQQGVLFAHKVLLNGR